MNKEDKEEFLKKIAFLEEEILKHSQEDAFFEEADDPDIIGLLLNSNFSKKHGFKWISWYDGKITEAEAEDGTIYATDAVAQNWINSSRNVVWEGKG